MAGRKATSGSGGTEPEPDPKRRRLLNAGGPVEDDETARQKMRNARVYKTGVDGINGEYDGFDPDEVMGVRSFSPYGGALSRSDAKTKYITAMGYFTKEEDLPMMRWLYVNGADTRDEDVDVCFPMYLAVIGGDLDICEWLFDHGAAKDVKRRTRGEWGYPNGRSPLSIPFGISFGNGPYYQTLSRWLILNGALCKDGDSGELDVEIMRQDLGSQYRIQERKALLDWATDLHRARYSCLLFLSGTISAPKHAYRTRRPSSPVRILSGKSEVLELIGDYTGIVCGREAKIIRQLTELLPDLNRELDE